MRFTSPIEQLITEVGLQSSAFIDRLSSGRSAPIPNLPGPAPEPPDSTRSGHSPASFNHLGGARQDRGRNREAERLSGREIDDQIEDGRLLNRQIGRLGTFQDSSRVTAGLAKGIRDPCTIADQAAGRGELAPHIVRWDGSDQQIRDVFQNAEEWTPDNDDEDDIDDVVNDNGTSPSPNSALPPLQLGSDVEIASCVSQVLCRDRGAVIFSEGRFWYYEGSHWRSFDNHELRHVVYRYD